MRGRDSLGRANDLSADQRAVIERDAAAREQYAPLVPTFELMRDLAVILNHRDSAGDRLISACEDVIEFDELGMMKGVTRSEAKHCAPAN